MTISLGVGVMLGGVGMGGVILPKADLLVYVRPVVDTVGLLSVAKSSIQVDLPTFQPPTRSVPPIVIPSNIIYVSNTATNGYGVGDDSNNRATASSKLTPKLTITSAISSALDGDGIIINDGEYTEASFLVINKEITILPENDLLVTVNVVGSGSRLVYIADNNVTIGALILDGRTNRNWGVSFADYDSENVVFHGTQAINCLSFGIFRDIAINNVSLYNVVVNMPNVVSCTGIQLTLGTGTANIINPTVDISSSSSSTGIRITGGDAASDLVISNGTVEVDTDSSYGIIVTGTNHAIEDNIIGKNNPVKSGILVPNHATLAVSISNVIDNTVYSKVTGEYGLIVGDDGTATPNQISNAIVRGNTINDANHGCMIGSITGALVTGNTVNGCLIGAIAKGSTNSVISYNLINGVLSAAGALRLKGCISDKMFKNTVYMKSDSVGPAILVDDNGGIVFSTGCSVDENIIYDELGRNYSVVGTGSDATFSKNLYFSEPGLPGTQWSYQGVAYTTLAAWNALTNVSDELQQDPMFTDVSSGDFTPQAFLQGTSPFVNGDGDQYDASGGEVWNDTYDTATGQARFGFSIGAYQFAHSAPFAFHLDIVSGTGPDDLVVKLPAEAELIDALGVDNQYYDALYTPQSLTWDSFVDNDQVRFGSTGGVIYRVGQDAATIAKIDRVIGNT